MSLRIDENSTVTLGNALMAALHDDSENTSAIARDVRVLPLNGPHQPIQTNVNTHHT